MSKLEELEEKYKIVRQSQEEKRIELAEVIDTVFKEMPMINRIMVYGSTPGFNDGDPCRHSGYISIDGWGNGDGFFIDDAGKVIQDYQLEDDDEMFFVSPHEKECRRVLSLFEDIDERLIQSIYDTNFSLVWFREPSGKIKFVKAFHHSGY